LHSSTYLHLDHSEIYLGHMTSSSPLDVFIDILQIEPSITCISGPEPLCARVLFLNTWPRLPFIDFSESRPLWNLTRLYAIHRDLKYYHSWKMHRLGLRVNNLTKTCTHRPLWISATPKCFSATWRPVPRWTYSSISWKKKDPTQHNVHIRPEAAVYTCAILEDFHSSTSRNLGQFEIYLGHMRSSPPLDVFIDILSIEPSITWISGPKPLCTRVLFLNTWRRKCWSLLETRLKISVSRVYLRVTCNLPSVD